MASESREEKWSFTHVQYVYDTWTRPILRSVSRSIPASPGFFRRRSAFLQLRSHTPKKVETQQQKPTNLLVPKLILLEGQKDIRIVIVG